MRVDMREKSNLLKKKTSSGGELEPFGGDSEGKKGKSICCVKK